MMGRKKGKLNYIIIGILIGIFSLIALCMREIVTVQQRGREKNAIQEEKWFCEQQSRALKEASDYLTDQFRRFLYSGSEAYMERYCDEVEQLQNREKAVEALKQVALTEEEWSYVNQARTDSYLLEEKETWAMRLKAEAKGAAQEAMPAPLQKVRLSEEEQQLSPAEKDRLALDFMEGNEYQESKMRINESLKNFDFLLNSRKTAEVQEAEDKVDESLRLVELFNILTVAAVLLLVFLFYATLVVPFMRYSKELEHISLDEDLILSPCGSVEMRTFAKKFNDVYADWRRQQRKLEHMNAIDVLTSIANRATLDEYVKQLIDDGKTNIGLLMMDVDNFKSFNDSYGHLVGDQVLIQIGKCFDRIAVKEGGIAGRLGGEEFIVVIPKVVPEQLDDVAAKIMESVRSIQADDLGISHARIQITVSVGSTIWKKGRTGDLNALIHQADMALYQAKGKGKNQHVMFSEYEDAFILMENDMLRVREVESDLDQALELKEFVPFFQPKCRLENGEICGAEVLVRWNHAQKGYLYPDYFVPVLEKDGFITRIDFVMFEELCRCIQSWQKEGITPIPVACNFSRLNLGKGTLVSKLLEITREYDVPPSLIQVEVTESGIMERDNLDQIKQEFEELRSAGFTIAIDDFGTGYSSLGMLHELSADVLKIDKSFVQRDLSLKANELLLNGIHYIAEVMKMETVVEGVETKEQVAVLQRLGYQVVQGFYFSKPVDKEKFRDMLKRQQTNKS